MGRSAAFSLLMVLCLGAPASSQDPNEPPPPRAAPLGAVTAEQLPRAGGVLLFGAADTLGVEIAKQLVADGRQVTAVVPEGADTAALKAAKVTTVTANATSPDQVKTAFTSAPFRLVVSIYDTGAENPDLGLAGTRNVIEATKGAGVPRLVFVSAVGAAESAAAVPWYVKFFRPDFAADLGAAETHLKASTLDYTIIRAGWRLDDAPTETALLAQNAPFSWISNFDLSELVIDILDTQSASSQTLTAYEPTRTSVWSLIF